MLKFQTKSMESIIQYQNTHYQTNKTKITYNINKNNITLYAHYGYSGDRTENNT